MIVHLRFSGGATHILAPAEDMPPAEWKQTALERKAPRHRYTGFVPITPCTSECPSAPTYGTWKRGRMRDTPTAVECINLAADIDLIVFRSTVPPHSRARCLPVPRILGMCRSRGELNKGFRRPANLPPPAEKIANGCLQVASPVIPVARTRALWYGCNSIGGPLDRSDPLIHNEQRAS